MLSTSQARGWGIRCIRCGRSLTMRRAGCQAISKCLHDSTSTARIAASLRSTRPPRNPFRTFLQPPSSIPARTSQLRRRLKTRSLTPSKVHLRQACPNSRRLSPCAPIESWEQHPGQLLAKPSRPTAPATWAASGTNRQRGPDFRFPAVCFSTSAAPRPSMQGFGCWNPSESKAQHWMTAVEDFSKQLRVNW
jgi:hypothetical protein